MTGDATKVWIPTPENQVPQSNHNPFHNWVTIDGRLTDEAQIIVGWALKVLAKACFVNSERHGWYEEYTHNGTELGQRNFGEVMALITSETSEALEEYRNGDDQTKIKYYYPHLDEFRSEPALGSMLGKPEGIAVELADVLIRVLDYVGAYNVPISDAVLVKHQYNQSRPYRHGGKSA